MANKTFSNTLRQAQIAGNASKLQDMSQSWLREKAKEIGKAQFVTNVKVGKMYLFMYDPKTKDELPYYDQLPLIFPFAKAKGGFYGINLHYLPYVYRAKLMDALYDLSTNSKYDYNTKLVLSYRILSSSAKFRYFTPCVKMYLNKHVRSRFINVSSVEWDKALFLPLERFAKKSKQQVFQESIKKIRG